MSLPDSQNTFDAIVIGSGIGGLSAASVLTQVHKKRVLILEKHKVLGGFTHTFTRKGYTWDVGLHYVGQMNPGESTRRAFDFVTKGKVKWTKMKSPFEVFVYPDFRFEVPDDRVEYQRKLTELFAHEVDNIKNYFIDVRRIPMISGFAVLPRLLRVIAEFFFLERKKLAEMSVGDYLAKNIGDLKLRALLCSQWGDYGLPPTQASMAVHSMIVNHYLDGAHYPVGGAKVIASSVQEILNEDRGKALTGRAVTSLIIDRGRICGVHAATSDGGIEQYFAPLVFSDIGVQNLYPLIPKENLKSNEQEEIKNITEGTSAVVLYLGLKANPSQLGIHGQNFWVYSSWDHDQIWKEAGGLLKGRANHCYISFPSLKDPEAKEHTAEIIAFVPHSFFQQWQDSKWQRRAEEYEATKKIIADALLNFAENEIPGLKSLVTYEELSTPLSSAHFTSHHHGQIYGVPATSDRLSLKSVGTHTPIKGLYNVGADVMGHGIVGALMGGVFGVASATGWSTLGKVMRN